MRAALIAVFALPCVAFAQSDLFEVTLAADAVTVSANRPAVPVDEALVELATAVGWGLEFETQQLKDRLSVSSIDVAFEQQGPRTIAHLIAVAGGGDVVFSDRTEMGRTSTRLIVVVPPSNDTESGRQRLRQWSIKWYRTLLQDELQHDPLVENQGMDARMHMAQLLREQGALEEAARVYADVPERDPTHDYVPTALLRLAECRFELGEDHWDQAESAARDLTRRHPSLPQSAAGTVLLGRILNERGRYVECSRTLTASYLRLAGTPEVIDLYLLVGAAEYALGRPEQVLRTMDVLDGAHDYRELDESQWLDYLFLRGFALHGLGQYEESLEPLELFLGMGKADPRRGIAFVLLGRTYLTLERFVEARAAAIEAHHLKVGGKLESKWAREASKFYAKTALEIGDRDEAFDKLEVEVRKSPESEPELVLYLARAFMQDGRFQKAIITADLIADLSDADGDDARLLRVEAMWQQSLAAGESTVRTFPERALSYATRVEGEENMRRVAEIFGQAWEKLGDVERAADAYRGMLRW